MTLHFIHRGLAYILLLLIIVLTIRLYKTTGPAFYKKLRPWPFILVFIQLLLGIFTVLTSLQIVPNQWGAYEWMAQLHQAVAMFLLLALVSIAYVVRSGKS
jgi:cytochrome c oxidase assembly protein subunit 15